MAQDARKKYILKRSSIFVLCLFVLGLSFFAVKKYINEPVLAEAQLQSPETFTLRQETASDELEFFGSLEANKQSKLSAKASGRIQSLRVKQGDLIKRGQLLAFLKPDQNAINYNKQFENEHEFDEYRDAQIRRYRSLVRVAEENLERAKAQRDYDANNDPDQISIDEENVDRREEQLESAKRERDAQDKYLDTQDSNNDFDVQLSAQNVADTRIYAPYNGIVLDKFLEEGEVVNAGQPIISVAEISSYKILVQIPDIYMDKLSLGLPVKVVLDGVDGDFNATVTRIYPQVDHLAKKIEVEITLCNVPMNVKVGMFARAIFQLPARTAFFVPDNFVYSGYEGPYVILDDGKQQPIQRISKKEGQTEIFFEGITDGIIIKNN